MYEQVCLEVYISQKMELGSLSIRISPIQTLGTWDLQKYNMVHMEIDKEEVQDLSRLSAGAGGVLDKFNLHFQQQPWYIKAGSPSGQGNYKLHEPIGEKIAADIARILGFKAVNYSLWVVDKDLFQEINLPEDSMDSWDFADDVECIDIPRMAGNEPVGDLMFSHTLQKLNKVLVSACPSFLQAGQGYSPCADLYEEGLRQELYHRIVEGVPAARSDLDQMMVFDFLIHNTDRHENNFGFITIDNQLQGLSSLFDHGHCLAIREDFAEFEDHEVEYLDEMAAGRPFAKLHAALQLIDRESLKGIRGDARIEELHATMECYGSLIGTRKVEMMKRLIERRYAHVQTLLSKT
ncbi:hypothetical protein ACFFSY_25340 [Paenibacillus aurantiacus]|uniref:HipA-like C-terminal domain-containing protein n=1 Tax=Paenibacillus aurantiacus TaxID=1936118 RepID=A0ABV5KVL6_9BACL